MPGVADVLTFDSANLSINLDVNLGAYDGIAYTANATGSVNITETAAGFLNLDGGAAIDVSVAAGNHTITGQNRGSTGDFYFSNAQVWNIATGASLTFANAHMRANAVSSFTIQGGGLLVFGGDNVGTANPMSLGNTPIVLSGNTTLKMTNNLASGVAANKYTVNAGSSLNLAANFNSVNGTLTISGTGVGGVGAIYNSSGNNTIADGSASVVLAGDSTIGVASSTTLTMGQDITETGGARQLTKVGTGTLVLGNTNTYSGSTLVTTGTLVVSGTLASTAGVTVSGGTLTLGAADRINDAAAFTMSGGTFNTGGFSETLSALTLTNSTTSSLDLGSVASILLFSGITANTGHLNITNWTTGSDSLRFTSNANLLASSFTVNGGAAAILNQGAY
jgi:autotransporter-associated beta strand protein